MAKRTGLDAAHVDALLTAGRPSRSLDEPLPDGVGAFGDLLADPVAEDEYERVLDSLPTQQLIGLLAELSDREREILRARHGLEQEQESLRDIGGRLGLSAERVRQLEQRALAKLAAAADG